MPISYPHKCILIHVPKCGGTSIESLIGVHGNRTHVGITKQNNHINKKEADRVLWGGSRQHWNALKVKKHVGDKIFNTFYKIGIVRNPYARVVSFFAHGGSEKYHGKIKWVHKEALGIEEFRKKIKNFTKLKHHRLKLASNMLCINGTLAVDKILRQETLNEDWDSIKEIIGIKESLPRRMKSVHNFFGNYYTPEIAEVVYKRFERDFKMFDYDKESWKIK